MITTNKDSNDCPKETNQQIPSISKGKPEEYFLNMGSHISVRDPKLLLPGECYIEMHQDGTYKTLDIKRAVENSDCEREPKPVKVSNKTGGKGSKKSDKKRILEQAEKYWMDKQSYITIRDPKFLLPGEVYIDIHRDGSYDILDIKRETENTNYKEESPQKKSVQAPVKITNDEKIKVESISDETKEKDEISCSNNHSSINKKDEAGNISPSKRGEQKSTAEETNKKRKRGKSGAKNKKTDQNSTGNPQDQKPEPLTNGGETKKKRRRRKKAGTNSENINHDDTELLRSVPVKRESGKFPTVEAKHFKTTDASHSKVEETSNNQNRLAPPIFTSALKVSTKRRTLFCPTEFENSPDFTILFGDYTKN